ncbi:MAG: 4-hydroxy-tetrahydrodipicolinate synthase, partial [Myxococcota bacterium]
EVVDGRVPVIAGTGHFDTKTTIAQAKQAMTWGIDAALVVTPYYNKPNQEGLFQHFKAVFEATGAPIVVYNVPGRTASDILPETLARLVEIGAAIGVKDATANMTRTAQTLATIGRDRSFAMLSGDDFTILPFVACGGKGVVSVVSNLIPGDVSRLVKLTTQGALAEANPLNDRVISLSKTLFIDSNPIPVKAGMAMAGWCEPVHRLPLVPATEAVRSAVQESVNAYRGQPASASLQGFLS